MNEYNVRHLIHRSEWQSGISLKGYSGKIMIKILK
jgi:hypothetical protein